MWSCDWALANGMHTTLEPGSWESPTCGPTQSSSFAVQMQISMVTLGNHKMERTWISESLVGGGCLLMEIIHIGLYKRNNLLYVWAIMESILYRNIQSCTVTKVNFTLKVKLSASISRLIIHWIAPLWWPTSISNSTCPIKTVLSVCQNILGTGIQEWIIQSSFCHKIHIQIWGNPKYTNKKTNFK